MKIRIEFYGGLRQRAGVDEMSINLEDGAPTVADAVEAVQREVPALKGILASVARAVDDEIVGDDHPLQENARVALLPPVSGGNAASYLSAEPLDRDRLIEESADDRCGALVIFSGDIRNHNEGRHDVVAIEYEAHEAIAARVMGQIEAEVVDDFEVHQCRIQHRVGRVEVGESSVLVVCRAPHRDGAFTAARYAIDELKKRVPLWKHEHYADGDSRYLEGTPLGAEDEDGE